MTADGGSGISGQTRRDFLQTAGTGLAAGVLLGRTGELGAEGRATAAENVAAIPPHAEMLVPGVHCYTDQVSVAAGEPIRIYVSHDRACELQVCRLGPDAEGPERDEILQTWPLAQPSQQPIHPGSYVHVAKGFAADEELNGLSVQMWVRLWDLPGKGALISQCDDQGKGTFGLWVDREGRVAFFLGDGGAFRKDEVRETGPGVVTRSEVGPEGTASLHRCVYGGRPVKWGKWHHIVGTWDGKVQRLWIDGKLTGEWEHLRGMRGCDVPLRIGASGSGGRAGQFLDADVAAIGVWKRSLSVEEVRSQFQMEGLAIGVKEGLAGSWMFSEERGERVADSSGNGRDGQIINHATWMIGGPSFQAAVPRYGGYDPAKDLRRGHGLRLASDDLYDCRWKPTLEFVIPKQARSGIYAVRIRFTESGEPRMYHCLFIVKKPVAAAKAPIAFLGSTNTWRAYAGTPFAVTWPEVKETIGHTYINSPGNPPNFCLYWQHRAGQGSYQMGLRMPWPVAGPYTFHQDFEWESSHLCHADRLTLTWLEREKFPVDVYSDLDLHRDPKLLEGYRAVFIVGHSEYWSRAALEALDQYLAGGGNLIAETGNSFFWRVSFDEAGTIMECRKVDAPGSQMFDWQRGEAWHSHDGKRGGMCRDCGMPGWPVVGLEYMSVHGIGVEGIGPYRAVNPDHFLFRRPNDLGLSAGSEFGAHASGMPELIGHEGDVRISTLAKVTLKPVPEGGVCPQEDPPGITLLAEGIADWSKVTEGAPWDYFQRAVVSGPERTATSAACEMIYWERPQGGRVFHAGSVSSGRGFLNDPRYGKLIENVLDHFGVKKPT